VQAVTLPSLERSGRCSGSGHDLDRLQRFAVALTSGYGIGDVLHNLSEEIAEGST
jgi:hypothetical protein